MLKPIRRVVTGLNAAGRSIILSDETVTSAFEMPQWQGRGVTAVWSSNQSPESELEGMSPELRAQLTVPVARSFPEAMEIDTSKSYQMHATDTGDYLIMLSGELTMMTDEGEVTLKPFDTLIQRGVNHGWINRGTQPALIASAILDAVPLKRQLSPKPKPNSGQLW